MQVAKPAVLKPGVTVESLYPTAQKPRGGDPLPTPRPSDLAGAAHAPPLVRGRALIFWDPKTPSKKLDAIDTDEITPAADCVSARLGTLDDGWRAGSVRYLMSGLRGRVHHGETCVSAGD